MEFRKIWCITGFFVAIDWSKPIGIVCHDAGGANQIIAMLQGQSLEQVSAYVEGPARSLWNQTFPKHPPAGTLEAVVSKASSIITGTGWASSLEHDARRAAKRQGIRSIAVLDHWTNYAERFNRDGETVLPDEIWVVDRYAEQLARRLFPEIMVRLHKDCYAEQQIEGIAPISETTPNEILYLLEPARSEWGRGEPGEFQALRFFLDCFPQLGLPGGTSICLRPHPSDPPGKYDAFLGLVGGVQIRLASGGLADAISRSRWVAGCQTYAMTLALRAGRVVYGSLPPWAPSCALPHEHIVHLKAMVSS